MTRPTRRFLSLNKHSSVLTQHERRGGARAMLVPCGVDGDRLMKPQVGIASVWWEGNPCNMHLLDLSARESDQRSSNPSN